MIIIIIIIMIITMKLIMIMIIVMIMIMIIIIMIILMIIMMMISSLRGALFGLPSAWRDPEYPVSLRRFPSFRTQPLENLTPLSMNKWVPEQHSPWRKSSKRESCYGDRVKLPGGDESRGSYLCYITVT